MGENKLKLTGATAPGLTRGSIRVMARRLPFIRQLALTFWVYKMKRSARVEKSVGDMVVRTKNEQRLIEWGQRASRWKNFAAYWEWELCYCYVAAEKGYYERVEGTSKRLTRTQSNGKEENWWG